VITPVAYARYCTPEVYVRYCTLRELAIDLRAEREVLSVAEVT